MRTTGQRHWLCLQRPGKLQPADNGNTMPGVTNISTLPPVRYHSLKQEFLVVNPVSFGELAWSEWWLCHLLSVWLSWAVYLRLSMLCCTTEMRIPPSNGCIRTWKKYSSRITNWSCHRESTQMLTTCALIILRLWGSNYTKYGFFPKFAYNNNEIKEQNFENVKWLGAAYTQIGSKRAAGIIVSDWEKCSEDHEHKDKTQGWERALLGLTTCRNTMKRQLFSNYPGKS